MTIRNVYRAVTVACLTWGVSAIPLVAQDHDHDSYIAKTTPKTPKAPKATHEHHDRDDDDNVTLVGCFIRGTDDDGDHVRYLLGNATQGPATTVADQNCIATGQVIRLKRADDVGLDKMTSGRWIEVYGELEKAEEHELQKFELRSFREVPQTPRVAVIIPIPVPEPPKVAYETPAPEPVVETPAPEPVATTGVETPAEVKKLPKTASSLPLIAMLGLFALTGGLVLGVFDRRRVLGRR